MVNEVRRDVVSLGLDFRPIPVDLGDGVEWEFSPDPDPQQWSALVNALKGFSHFADDDFGGDAFESALSALTEAMANVLVDPKQKKKWVEKRYGLGAQQAISSKLMELWTGFPTKEPKPSGKGSRQTG